MLWRVVRFAVISLLVLGCSRFNGPEIPIYGSVPDFSLTDQLGRTVTLRNLAGHVWVADFIFTHCDGTCPVITQSMRKLQDSLPQPIQMISFTVDPTRDTPSVLAAYAKRYNANEDRWSFLTGDKDRLYDLSVHGFKLALDDAGGTEAEPITHSTRLVLVDQQGRIRGYYGGTEEDELKRLAADAGKLL
jgi:cytochrome oxidase Cu insertion factor (SCO1/SenC/PrrC family)